jgi:hypothetical protein
MALTTSRMLSIDHGQVCCRDQDAQPARWHTMPLPAQALIRRFLPHVWPQGFHTVRSDGLWRPVHRPLWHHLQLWLAAQHPAPPRTSDDRERQSASSPSVPLHAGQRGPSCGQG